MWGNKEDLIGADPSSIVFSKAYFDDLTFKNLQVVGDYMIKKYLGKNHSRKLVSFAY